MVVNKLVIAFVTLIVGIALLSQVSVISLDATDKTSVNNEAVTIIKYDNVSVNTTRVYTLTNAPTGWKTADCPLASIVLSNSSGTVFTITTDYLVTPAAGTFTLKNTTATTQTADNKTYVDYTYCADDYLNLSWGRSVINYVPGFFAIALLLVSLGFFYSVAKEAGIL